MSVDAPVLLCTPAQLKAGAFADLVQSFSEEALLGILAEATRACETEVGRRLAPFTGLVESHRMDGIDPDEYGDSAGLPLDLPGALGRSWGAALGSGTNLVRHLWLNQFAPHYPDLWSYTDVQITVSRSYGGGQEFAAGDFIGPEPDSGHVWFRLGTWLPVGSWARVTYSGGYQTIPADLTRACKWMAASICCRELVPLQINAGHDATELEALAVSWLSPYGREH